MRQYCNVFTLLSLKAPQMGHTRLFILFLDIHEAEISLDSNFGQHCFFSPIISSDNITDRVS